ncbi:hypothetical protein BO85DRAFT_248500 [Aspergillus piperis CBS 112811]|uniref:Uncharacterized protein n=1 Tax=Aspergillus piperis CBS 112811 TaxID=1448313 RepID=A0A8G1R5Q9_9EURO|nr:hypothetical protein BO85DRAFT_248500 [Aspergillus piperis CBS 112811]RAH59702.1 hypothetical protein BO85DRAFT_248500 [Aspergillus piperis CBS 112811]
MDYVQWRRGRKYLGMNIGVMAYTTLLAFEAWLLANETCGRPFPVHQWIDRESRLRSFAMEPKIMKSGSGRPMSITYPYVSIGGTLDLNDAWRCRFRE